MVPKAQGPVPSQLGIFRKDVGRPYFPLGIRCGGLHPKPGSFHHGFEQVFQGYKPKNGYVCQPGQRKISKILLPVSSFSSHQGKCFNLSPRGLGGGLCKSTMEGYHPLASEFKGIQTPKMSIHMPLLGFSHFLAPVNRSKKVWDQVFNGPPRVRMFTNCHGDKMPAPKWPQSCRVLSGQDWSPRKCKMPTSKIIWTP